MKVDICFHGELNDLLQLKKRGKQLTVEWKGRRSVKDLVESQGVPHTEVGGIRVHDRWVDFSYILREGDRVVVFPVNSSSELCTGSNPLFNPDPIKDPKFICDVHLWKLARRLRLLGFDTWFDPQWDDAQLANLSQKEGLILLTRDRGLLIRSTVQRGIYIHSTDPEIQVKEVLHRLNLFQLAAPFTRCLLCNGFLEPVDTEGKEFETKYRPLIPEGVMEWSKEFHFCPSCQKMFWKGTHYDKLTRKIENYLSQGD